jgi:hypothetical protein
MSPDGAVVRVSRPPLYKRRHRGATRQSRRAANAGGFAVFDLSNSQQLLDRADEVIE